MLKFSLLKIIESHLECSHLVRASEVLESSHMFYISVEVLLIKVRDDNLYQTIFLFLLRLIENFYRKEIL